MTGPPPYEAPVRLLLIRHGHDAGAAFGLENPLSARGQAQADWLAPSLGAEGVTALLSSPLVRARETADRLAAALGLEVRVEQALGEFLLGAEGAGSDEDAPTDAQGAAPTAAQRDVLTARPDLAVWHAEHRGASESLADFQTRVTALLTSLVLRAAPGDTLALVTHAGVIDAALRWAWGLTSRNPWMAEAALAHASVTEIAHWPRGRHPLGAPRYSVVRRLGDVSALPADLVSE